MKRYLLFPLFVVFIISGCSTQTSENPELSLAKNQMYFYGTDHARPDAPQDFVETSISFADSTSLGQSPGEFKIELNYEKKDESELQQLTLTLYKKEYHAWSMTQRLVRIVDVLAFLPPDLDDFNADGYMDLSAMTGTAARGANEVRTLFLFNPDLEQFYPIRNSERYPNLAYNQKTNGLTAMLYSGSVSTVFLEIRGDSLVAIANVSLTGGRREVNRINAQGKYEMVSSTYVNDPDFTRYCNHNPVEIAVSEW